MVPLALRYLRPAILRQVGIVEGYAFLWEANLREQNPQLLAVARPQHIANIGEKVVLDASRSWASDRGKRSTNGFRRSRAKPADSNARLESS
jgi:hypothetical protein